MKKLTALVMAGLLVLALGAGVMAAEPMKGVTGGKFPMMGGTEGHRMMQLTDEQKQELQPLMQQMLEIKKQMIAKQVAWGNLTQEQADRMISHMQERMDKGPGAGMMMGGHGKHHGQPGHGGPGQNPNCPFQQAPDKVNQ